MWVEFYKERSASFVEDSLQKEELQFWHGFQPLCKAKALRYG